MNLQELHAFLLHHLTEEVMPFWIRYSLDWKNGGMWTCLADDGSILSRDKYIWSNARALWTFSALVNRITNKYSIREEIKDVWRRAAMNQYHFLKRYGRDANGYWVFVVDEVGNVLVGENSIATDAFAIYGFIEYFRMTGDEEALAIARETAVSCRERLAHPGSYKTAPYTTPSGMKAHREAMQFSLMFSELGHELRDDSFLEEGLRYGREVLDHFYRADRGVLLEYLGMDNSVWDTPAGRVMVPGHAIESLWFQIHNFTRVGDTARAHYAAEAMRPCLEKGWDPLYGGLFLGIDVEGKELPYWKHADKKLWWPFTEALCGTLLAYEQVRDEWCLEWYWKIHNWAFAHFPDKEHGEWTQKLDRQGNKIDEVIALPVKDPFHLPRGLIVAIETLERLTRNDRRANSI
nr:AGE family epimerase/isomerase [Chloroflexota bacterium]